MLPRLARRALVALLALSAFGARVEASCDNAVFAAVVGGPKFLQGLSTFNRLVSILNDPSKYLDPKYQPTAEQKLAMARAAFDLVNGDTNAANKTHLADHEKALAETILKILSSTSEDDAELRKALEAAGVTALDLHLLVFTHDMGKVFAQLPDDLKAFVLTIYPMPASGERDTAVLQRFILAHEMYSMAILDRLGKAQNLAPEQIAYLQALIARHNAGYDPDLAGVHFWKSTWGMLVSSMAAFGIDLPAKYGPVLTKAQGGKLTTIILTAIDRLVSLLLSSQEKFSLSLIGQGKWSSDGLAALFRGNAAGVPQEARSVLGYARDFFATAELHQAFMDLLLKQFDGSIALLKEAADRLEASAAATPAGEFADRPKVVPAGTVVFRAKESDMQGYVWFAVASDGTFYRAKANGTFEKADPAVKGTPDTVLFRNVIFPTFGYTPATLTAPSWSTK